LLIRPHPDPTWRQFRFSVGAPDAEAKFQAAIKEAQQVDKNANQFPHLYVCLFLILSSVKGFILTALLGLPWIRAAELAFGALFSFFRE
jgi:hypothetical protein